MFLNPETNEIGVSLLPSIINFTPHEFSQPLSTLCQATIKRIEAQGLVLELESGEPAFAMVCQSYCQLHVLIIDLGEQSV